MTANTDETAHMSCSAARRLAAAAYRGTFGERDRRAASIANLKCLGLGARRNGGAIHVIVSFLATPAAVAFVLRAAGTQSGGSGDVGSVASTAALSTQSPPSRSSTPRARSAACEKRRVARRRVEAAASLSGAKRCQEVPLPRPQPDRRWLNPAPPSQRWPTRRGAHGRRRDRGDARAQATRARERPLAA